MKILILIISSFVLILSAQAIEEPKSSPLEMYIITLCNQIPMNYYWYNESQSINYHAENWSIVSDCYYDSILVPNNQSRYDYGYEFVGALPFDTTKWNRLRAGVYKITIDQKLADDSYPYFFFDYRDQNFNDNLPGYGSSDINIIFNHESPGNFQLCPRSNPSNIKTVPQGTLITHWDVHGNTPPLQSGYEASSTFNLCIQSHYTGHPYLFWNQTTPQGTQYRVYRKITGTDYRFYQITSPMQQLFYIDEEIDSDLSGTTVSYYIRTTEGKSSNTCSTQGLQIVNDKHPIKKVISLDLDQSANLFPNPFNSTIRINLCSPMRQITDIMIYDLQGRTVKEFRPAPGIYYFDTIWNGADNQGQPIQSGIYFLIAHNGSKTLFNQKIIYLK